MIVLGRVVPLKNAAEYDFSGIAESKLHSKTAMMMIGPLNPSDSEGCCDFGFTHNADQYILGYNSVTLISNFRNLLDALKDLAFYLILSWTIRQDEPRLLQLMYPVYGAECLMFFDMLTLRRNELAETFDVVISFINTALGVGILHSYYYGSNVMGEWIVFKLCFTIVAFLYVRLFQRRFNKNIGANLLKIGIEVQLLLMWKNNALNTGAWTFDLKQFIPLLILGAILSLVSGFHVIVLLKRFANPFQSLKMVNVTDLAVLISWVYGPLLVLLLISFQECNVVRAPAKRSESSQSYCGYRNTAATGFAILAAIRFLLAVPMNRYVNKMSKVNEANNLGSDGTFTTLYGLFRKDYLSF